ncbi:MAG: alpha-hydroxy-acid oxidizing protein [Gammaproteobacteria bacterium]|nr:alpha-hydroxy-acid oxidizing protein [Gammaproteobacteria bacterium]
MKYLTLHEIAKAAQRNLDRNHWDYLVGGADTEASLRRNRYGLDSWVFRPRILNDVSVVEVASEFLGTRMRIPVLLPPIGSVQVFEPGGGQSVAEAAAEFGVLQVLSSVCTPDFEEVAARVPGPRIYQLYLMGDQTWMDDIIARAVAAGYTGFCLTADTQTYSRRERDLIKRFTPPSGSQAGTSGFNYQGKMTWDTVEHIKNNFDIPLLIKGVNVGEDAARCVDAGVDVVWVSNHGGRQLDHTRACIDALPEVVEAVDGRAPVVVDGGFMRGADVVKGLCLGADAVAMGRLEGLAMAAGGKDAMVRALEIVEREITTTMTLLGVAHRKDLKPALLERAAPTAPSHALSAFPFLDDDAY